MASTADAWTIRSFSFFFSLLLVAGCDANHVGKDKIFERYQGQARELKSYDPEYGKNILYAICFFVLPWGFLGVGIWLFLKFACPKPLPSDVVPLPDAEANRLLDLMQGEWRVSPMVADGRGRPVRVAISHYERAVIKGNSLILSGGTGRQGRPLPTQVQTFDLTRSPDGTIYLDKLGSYLETEIDDIQTTGTMGIMNALGMNLDFTRAAAAGSVAVGPVGVQNVADELDKLYRLKMNGILTEDEFQVQKERLLEGQYRNTRSLLPAPVKGDGDNMPMGGGAPLDDDDDEEDEDESDYEDS